MSKGLIEPTLVGANFHMGNEYSNIYLPVSKIIYYMTEICIQTNIVTKIENVNFQIKFSKFLSSSHYISKYAFRARKVFSIITKTS